MAEGGDLLELFLALLIELLFEVGVEVHVTSFLKDGRCSV